MSAIASATIGEVDIHKLSKLMGTSLRILEALLEVGGCYGDVQIGLRCREKRYCVGGKPALIATDL